MSNSLSDYKIKKIMMFFCQDITASKTALLLGINRNTINRYFLMRLSLMNPTLEHEEFVEKEVEELLAKLLSLVCLKKEATCM